MLSVTLDVDQWAEQQFGNCRLGDSRRTKRLVTMAAQFAQRPDGSTPDQTENWADLKATYRFFDNNNVSHRAILKPHFAWTCDLMATQGGTVLLVSDTTEVDFGHKREATGLSPTGNGSGRGFFLHTSLAVDRGTGQALGMVAQELFHRKKAPAKETPTQRLTRARESEVWGRVVDSVGSAPEGTVYRHVFDRGADNYEVFCHLVHQECEWVVRAAQTHRVVETRDGRRLQLSELLAEQEVRGTRTVQVKAQPNQSARSAKMEMRYVRIVMPRPRNVSPWVKENGASQIAMSAVQLLEPDPPKGCQALNWILLNSDPVKSPSQARRVIEDYEKRPVVEELHKAAKTGCRMEDRQYRTSARLERVTAVQCVIAVRLLQLRAHARLTPERPAIEIVPEQWVRVINGVRHGGKRQDSAGMTVRDFYRALAQLGGFVGRKSDGEPGWITLWRGFEKLQLILRGVNYYDPTCG
jgi:hypothetical protein